MSDALDLFGLASGPMLTPEQRKKVRNSNQPRGHAWRPGTGPAGETCKSCRHLTRVRSKGGNVFRKCGLMRTHWTHGPGSDIRAKDPACRHWEAMAK
jgi:hypothetical protein